MRDLLNRVFVLGSRLVREGRCQIHAVLDRVLAFPFLVGGFVRMIEVVMLLVQRLSESGRKQRFILGEASGHRTRTCVFRDRRRSRGSRGI
ncbi:MAG: hypothetical protein DMG81_05235 [Acidobacteria bacterium]|nr:MAG: hypothetical protein DMG81_05235 [Acidobacteriota bacterium]